MTEYVKEWNIETGEWFPERRVENSYLDSTSKITINEGWIWDPQTDQWEGRFRNEYEYDEHKNRISSTECDWVSETESWQCGPYEKRDLVFSVNGFLMEESRSRWVNDHWENRYKYEYEEDSLARSFQQIRYDWNLDSSQWEPNSKSEWLDDVSGRDSLTLGYLWEQDTGYWGLSSIYRPEYDASGRMNRTESWSQQPLGTNWRCKRTDIEYNAHGEWVGRKRSYLNSETELFELWQTDTRYLGAQQRTLYESLCQGDSLLWQGDYYKESCWQSELFIAVTGVDSIHELDLTVFDRPASFTIQDISGLEEHCEGETVSYTVPENVDVVYSWYSDYGLILDGQATDTVEFQWTTSMGEPTLLCWAENQFACVSDTSVLAVQLMICDAVEEEEGSDSFLLYPVPVRGFLFIQSDMGFVEIRVVDLLGREVIATTGTSVDLSALESGIYLVRLHDSDGTLLATRKIVKE